MKNFMRTGKLYSSPFRFRTIILSLVLTYTMIQSILHSPSPLLGIILLCGCLGMIWIPQKIVNSIVLTTAAAVITLIALIFWILFDQGQIAFSILIFLNVWTGFRLPSALSAVYAVISIIAVSGIELWLEDQSYQVIMTQCIILAGVYILMWGGRVRRSAQAMNELHFRELSAAHEQLEETYAKLSQAHHELEEAAERTLRYAVLEERNRIAADIHDSIGHGLTSVIVQLQALPYMIQSSPDAAQSTIGDVIQVTRHCLQDVRAVVHEMGLPYTNAGVLELQSLAEDIEKQSGLIISFTTENCRKPFQPEIAHLLYRVLQEALTNIMRHAQAFKAEVILEDKGNEIVMAIRDDGQISGPVTPGFGLSTMRARCEKVGGSLTISPLVPHGLELLIQLPVYFKDTKIIEVTIK